MTLVSVVITTFNGARWLPETLGSVLAQTHPDVEIVVVDDGSTDDTATVLERHRDRIKTVRQANLGLAAARNAGIAAATGSLIALLDHDDLWEPDKLAIQVALAARHPNSGLVACAVATFDDSGAFVEWPMRRRLDGRLRRARFGAMTADLHRAFLRGNFIACPAQTLIPRWAIDRTGSFVDSGAQDYDYYLRLAQRFPVTVHPDSLALWRQHPDSMSGATDRRAYVWTLQTVPVLVRHRGRCTGIDRVLATWWLEHLIIARTLRAVRLAMAGDRTYAADFLRSLDDSSPHRMVSASARFIDRLPSRLPAIVERLAKGRSGLERGAR